MWCSLTAIVFFMLILVESDGTVNSNESSTFTGQSDNNFPQPWVSDLFYQALANFTPRNVGSIACRKQTEMYDRHLRNHTSWAIKMAESWNRYPVGVLEGNTYQMGIYDECINIQYPVRGQYCLSVIKLNTPNGKDYSFNRIYNVDYFGKNNAWHTILGWINYSDQFTRNSLTIGVCIPDSCSAMDLQTSLQKDLDVIFNSKQLKTIVKVDPLLCTVSGDMYPRDSSFYMTCMGLTVLILICCSSTLYDIILLTYRHSRKETNETYDISDSVFNSFSFIKTGKELLKFNKDNVLNSLHGFKVLVMIITLLGHRFLYFSGKPIDYPKFIEQLYLYGPSLLMTGMNMVDPFFLISGYLMYVVTMPKLKKAESTFTEFLMQIIRRISRILPAYIVMMLIMAHIVPHLGDGPLWPKETWNEAEICKKYWWLNLLFINNFFDVKYECLIVSWYIACDVQFFVVGAIILYIHTKNPKYGIRLLISMLIISLSVPFVYTLLTKSDGMLKMDIQLLENLRNSKTYNESYRPSFMRATPFFSGLAMAILIEKLKENKFKFSQKTVFGGTLVVFVIFSGIQMYGMVFYKRDRPYYSIENALYSTVSHCTYTMLGSWVGTCIFTTGYGPITKLLNNRLFVPMGKISFSVCLVNLVVILMSSSDFRSPIHPSVKNLIDAMIHDVFKTYLMGLILYMVVEAPFRNLTDRIFGARKKVKPLNTYDLRIEKTTDRETSNKETTKL